ncbi:type III PLP-dependent enzyme [Zavarzinia sp. CC-PAN008]|uniref:type III PLP-dependent enzyme n=1 Tax=Zavarzinia sp. CC-PAN008 TaxID=3243332 RepID=UPI003F74A4B2
MRSGRNRFESVDRMVEALDPSYPVLCILPDVLARTAQRFDKGFPGKVLYAVKCNPHPLVLNGLWQGGIRSFDTASLPEIALVKELLPEAHCCFNHPVKSRTAIQAAHDVYGIEDYVVDSPEELEKLVAETGPGATVQVRLATASGYAAFDLSLKFGAKEAEAVQLLRQVKAAGLEPAISFHVGSQCRTPEAYTLALAEVGRVIEAAGVQPRYVNVGGGFPAHYRGTQIPPLADFFDAIRKGAARLNVRADCELYCEPGRALVVEAAVLVVQVHLRRGNSLYVNDGVFGSLSELNVGKLTPPVRLIRRRRDGEGEPIPFRIFGPTCDSADVLPEPFVLPDDVDEGDWIAIGQVGAYSNALASHFNGFYCDTVVEVGGGI